MCAVIRVACSAIRVACSAIKLLVKIRNIAYNGSTAPLRRSWILEVVNPSTCKGALRDRRKLLE